MASGNGMFGSAIKEPLDEATRRVDARLAQLFLAMSQMQETFVDAVAGLEYERDTDSYSRKLVSGVFENDGTGIGWVVLPLGAPPVGTEWIVDSFATVGNTELLLTMGRPNVIADVFGSSPIWQKSTTDANGFAMNLNIPGGTNLYVVAFGNIGNQVFFTLNYRQRTSLATENAV